MRIAFINVRAAAAVLVFATAVTGIFMLPAFAQSGTAQGLANRLDRLERDIRAINRQVYRGGTPPSAARSAPAAPARPAAGGGGRPVTGSPFAIRTDQRLSQLEGELRTITGNVETIDHTIREIKERLDKLVADIDARLANVEARYIAAPVQPGVAGQAAGSGPRQPQVSAAPRSPGVQQVGPATGGPVFGTRQGVLGTITPSDLNQVPGRPPAAAAPPVLQPPAPPVKVSVLPKGTPRQRYQHAFLLLRQADYQKASAAFQEFVDSHPDDQLAGNARYWLGETYYVRGDYGRAAEIFLSGFRSSPQGKKAPAALLKLGMSLIALKKNREACATFDKLAKDYPRAQGGLKRVLDQQRKRAECGT